MNRGSAAERANATQRNGGFNEAPIHESGKYYILCIDTLPNERASMRPRFMNRGSGGRLISTS